MRGRKERDLEGEMETIWEVEGEKTQYAYILEKKTILNKRNNGKKFTFLM